MPTKDPEKKRAHWKLWYEKHKNDPKYKKKLRDFDLNRKKDLIEWVNEIKSKLTCKVCGFSHPAALDFHHRDPATKKYHICDMPYRGISKKKILEEMAKCDVYCANCHRIHHWNEKQPVIV